MPLGRCEFCEWNVWKEFKPTVPVLNLHKIYDFSIFEATGSNFHDHIQESNNNTRPQQSTH
jgi:hypothetical protein